MDINYTIQTPLGPVFTQCSRSRVSRFWLVTMGDQLLPEYGIVPLFGSLAVVDDFGDLIYVEAPDEH